MEAPFAIHFSRCPDGVLRASVAGVRSLQATIAYWDAILTESGRERPTALMVLDDLVGEELAASEWKQLVQNVAGRGLEGIPIAHVKPFSFDQMSYCERYANEAGLIARTFRRKNDAIAWLQARAG